MLYLILAIASSALVSLSIRASEPHISNKYGMLMVNYIVCTLCSLLYMDKNMGIFMQVAGIALAVIAIVMIHFEKKAIHEGSKKIWLLWV